MKFLIYFFVTFISLQSYADICTDIIVNRLFHNLPSTYSRDLLLDLYCDSKSNFTSDVLHYLKETGNHPNLTTLRENECGNRKFSLTEAIHYLGEETKSKYLECNSEELKCLVQEEYPGFFSLFLVSPNQDDIIKSINLGKFTELYDVSGMSISEGENIINLYGDNEIAESSLEIITEKSSCNILYRKPPLVINDQSIKTCATLFEHINFDGRSFSIFDTKNVNTISSLSTFGLNDTFSSVKINNGCTLTLFESDDYKGLSTSLSSDHSDFRSLMGGRFQDSISSAKCTCENDNV